MKKQFGILSLAVFLTIPAIARAALPVAKTSRTNTVDFEKEILPIFRANCLACHNQTKARAGMNLETPDLIRKGGDSGPGVVAGKSAESLLFKSASHAEDPIMPPPKNNSAAKNLTPEQLALVKLWIDQGAKGEVKGFVDIAWQPLPVSFNPIYSVALSPDGQYAACNRANRIHIYHLPTEKLVAELVDPKLEADKKYAGQKVAHHDMAYTLKFNPGGDLLVSGSYQEVKFWRLTTPAPVALGGNQSAKLAASADGNRFVIGEGSSARIYEASTRKELRTVSLPNGSMTDIAIAPDGNSVAASGGKVVYVWSVSDGNLLAEISAPTNVTAITFFGGSDWIAAGGIDKVIHTWKIPASNKEKPTAGKELAGHTAAVTSMASAGGNIIISGSEDSTVRSWDAATGKAIRSFNHGVPVSRVVATLDGKVFASLGQNHPSAKMWEAANGKLIKEVKGDFRLDELASESTRFEGFTRNEVTYYKGALKKAEDNKKKTDDAVKKANEDRDKLAKAFPEKEKALKAAEAEKAAVDKQIADAETAVKGTKDDKAKAEEQKKLDAAKKKKTEVEKKLIEAQKPVQEFRNSEDQAKRAVVDATRAGVAVAKAKTELKTAEDQTVQAKKELDATKARAAAANAPWNSVSFSADNRLIAALNNDGSVFVMRADNGQGISKHALRKSASMVFVGDQLVSHAAETALNTVERSWKLERTIGTSTGRSPLTGRVYSTAFSPDGKLLTTGSGDPSRSGQIVIWEVATGKKAQEIYNGHSDIVLGLDFSRDGKWLASGAADKFAKVWEVSSGKKLNSFEGHTQQVMGVALKTDMRTMLSAGADGIIKVWHLVTGEAGFTIKGYNKEITSVQFIGFESEFLVATAESHVRFLNERGGATRSFSGATDFVNAAATTSDKRVVIAGGQDGVLRVWNGLDGKLLHSFEPPAVADKSAVASTAKK